MKWGERERRDEEKEKRRKFEREKERERDIGERGTTWGERDIHFDFNF